VRGGGRGSWPLLLKRACDKEWEAAAAMGSVPAAFQPLWPPLCTSRVRRPPCASRLPFGTCRCSTSEGKESIAGCSSIFHRASQNPMLYSDELNAQLLCFSEAAHRSLMPTPSSVAVGTDQMDKKNNVGGQGYRSLCLLVANETLYHLS
jgi:hypothetical protein